MGAQNYNAARVLGSRPAGGFRVPRRIFFRTADSFGSSFEFRSSSRSGSANLSSQSPSQHGFFGLCFSPRWFIHWAWISGIFPVVHTWCFSEDFLESRWAPASLLAVFLTGAGCFEIGPRVAWILSIVALVLTAVHREIGEPTLRSDTASALFVIAWTLIVGLAITAAYRAGRFWPAEGASS